VDDYEVIKLFVTHLRDHGFPDLQVERHPDKENPGISDIDAIAGNFAIEHTSIDTLVNQRRNSDWFSKIVGGLDKELSKKVSSRIVITFPYHAIRKGQNWAEIREALINWVISKSSQLEEGTHIINDISDVEFQVNVRGGDWKPGLLFARFEPNDETLPSRIKTLFDRKLEKLGKYHSPECTTVLLVENNDIALMNDWKMLESIRNAYPDGMPYVDEIWYADTSCSPTVLFNNFTSDLR